MNELVLHHYATSPFSEKVRLVLGMKGMRWRSVIGAGDHAQARRRRADRRLSAHAVHADRRRHLLRLGADVPGDRPPRARAAALSGSRAHGLADDRRPVGRLESFFWTAVPYTMQPAGVAHLFAGAPPEAVKAFGADRAAMSPSLRRAPLHDAGRRTSTTTSAGSSDCSPTTGRSCSARSPSIADFSAAQSIWFMRRAPPVRGASRRLPARSTSGTSGSPAFGHGDVRAR